MVKKNAMLNKHVMFTPNIARFLQHFKNILNKYLKYFGAIHQ